MPPALRTSVTPQRGAAALVVVMMLFFIMSLVAAYASRNLIFEQRTSANQYRSTQAFEAAEAGLEWALAMLNGGRIDEACVGTTDTTKDTFRNRYLEAHPVAFIRRKTWSDAGTDTPFRPTCVRDSGAWVCSCPSDGGPILAAPAGAGQIPAFRITFDTVGTPPGVIRVASRGCSNYDTECLAGVGGAGDANAEVIALLGLAPSLSQTPAAALTVRGDLVATTALTVANADALSNGITINVGGAIPTPPPTLFTVPGNPSPGASVADGDESLSDLEPAGSLSRGEMMFLATFGMPPQAYRVQATVVRLTCGGDCATQLQNAVAEFPGRVIWVDGDLDLAGDAALSLGTIDAPVILVVDGDLNFPTGSSFVVNGVVYARGAEWNATGSDATVVGAFIAEGLAAAGLPGDGRFTIQGGPTIVFDADVVARLKQVKARQVLDFGSFARVPGSWRDFR